VEEASAEVRVLIPKFLEALCLKLYLCHNFLHFFALSNRLTLTFRSNLRIWQSAGVR
jgi:hypothetical protein